MSVTHIISIINTLESYCSELPTGCAGILTVLAYKNATWHSVSMNVWTPIKYGLFKLRLVCFGY